MGVENKQSSFQLCRVFRSHAMEVDQRLLDTLPLGQLMLRRVRCDQIQAYYEREKVSQKQMEPKKMQKVTFPKSDLLQEAIVHHNHKEVLQLLRDGVDPKTIIPSGGSLLHLCARHDNALAAEVLIACGLSVDQQDDDLWTPLHMACACGSSDSALLLLTAGANVLLQDIYGNFPMDYTVEGTETNYILMKYLKMKSLDLDILHLLKSQCQSSMLSDVQHLLATEGSVNEVNDEGVTLLHMACASGFEDVVSLLLEAGADPQVADDSSSTPLHLAARYGQISIVAKLLRHGADPSLLNHNKDRPSDVAASRCIADMLLRAEECWERKLGLSPAPSPGDQSEGNFQDGSAPNRKLTHLALPICKQDSIAERETMLRESPQALPSSRSSRSTERPSQLEQVKLVPPAPNDDLASLSELTDSSLLYEMQKRFSNNQIYTYIGHILLILNPNKGLPIYSALVSQLYYRPRGHPCPSLPPHIFSSAERAFRAMLREGRPQCFVLSGESGSGKTVASQHIVQHLTVRSGPEDFALGPQMEHINCILEAFSHAKTEMNGSSSRFIKFLSLQYKEKTLTGGRLYIYLFEKSRLISPPQYQRNFNIFYLIAEGMSSEEKSRLYLNSVLTHRYLSQGTPGDMAEEAAPSEQSRERLASLRQALQGVGFSIPDVENLFVLLSAILHLGDLCFTGAPDEDGASVLDSCMLERVSDMLQVSPEDLSSALTSDVTYIKGDVITRQHTVEMSSSYRDYLAKSLYNHLFNFLVNIINRHLQDQERDKSNSGLEIDILDIFGFEDFQKNSFEQLCVNMTDEKIHQYVTEVLFMDEQRDCLQEGVAMETSYHPRNQSSILDFFFQAPHGLFSVLDAESRSPCPEELSFYRRLQASQDAGSAAGVLLSPKDSNGNPPAGNQGPTFTVTHYAGTTTYDLTGLLERNKDNFPQSLLLVMKSSENILINQMFKYKMAHTGVLLPPSDCFKTHGHKAGQFHPQPTSACAALDDKYRDISKLLQKDGTTSLLQRLEENGRMTVAAQLANSLSEITSKLKGCAPHFIHCIKPNDSKRPDFFNSQYVSSQLQHVGVLEMVKMIRYGYPVRLSFTSFLAQYQDLAATILKDKRMSSVEKCRHVLQHCKLQGWKIGQTKVFLKFWQAKQLDDQCHQMQRRIIMCQKVVRGWLARKHMQRRALAHQMSTGGSQNFSCGSEEQSQMAYDGPVSQSDVAHKIGALRKQLASLRLVDPQELVEKAREIHTRDANKSVKVNEDSTERSRILRNFCSSSVPLPLAVDSLVHSAAGLSIKPPSQQTEGGGSGSCLSSPRKQPPPKPKRDPNTRLSTSIEAASASLSICPQNALDEYSKPRPHSDDYSTTKKIPPPKPIRSPNTKLTGSFEEILSPRSVEMKLACLSKGSQGLGFPQQWVTADGLSYPTVSLNHSPEEDVYIEMLGNPRITGFFDANFPEQDEAVYEEMKYSKPEGETVTMTAASTTPDGPSSPANTGVKTPIAAETSPLQGLGGTLNSKSGTRDVPSPFPNLLPHRPPLLIFPPPQVPYSSALDESPLTPLEVKMLPMLETNLNYSSQGDGGSPLSPKCTRQRADSLSTIAAIQDKCVTPLSPPLTCLPPAKLPPPYKTPSYAPFPSETSVPVLTQMASAANASSGSQKVRYGSAEAPPGIGKTPYSPVKKAHSDSRRAHSCCSSPLLFNPNYARPLSSPLDELSTIFSTPRSLLRKSANSRKIRDTGFNSNMNQAGRVDSGPPSPSPQLQDNNANNHPFSSPISIENGNQLCNGLVENESQLNIPVSLQRHVDRHQSQRDHFSFSPFGEGAAL
ncbi:unconventional myosin-XVI-like isoform X2 [Paramormyrops kingsleyae]|uniref:unconventional myosin-XVI-like isoform X2 n=1 Tax=Paramormyrops kingsleyae TaxID=1676925 RepID=UPI003B96ADF4